MLIRFFLRCNWNIISMKYWCVKSTDSTLAAICILSWIWISHLAASVCIFPFFLPPHTLFSFTSRNAFFVVTPLCSWQVATAWEDSLYCRAMQAAGAHVWLGCQWITLYRERKLKMQGCNLLKSGTDLKAFFPVSLLCLKFPNMPQLSVNWGSLY